ncbi:hypothetical protein BU16DRAFT_160605 [Lophium mytilinum]|uniref:Uncharacterized protein n=1 Tax=Lophium mytilinum TaxID=390894 RepID=A0A6A6QBG4_9PEZI|nr:hypothetical protein BU16DRAFT_160605 [Lophium mytilinum]
MPAALRAFWGKEWEFCLTCIKFIRLGRHNEQMGSPSYLWIGYLHKFLHHISVTSRISFSFSYKSFAIYIIASLQSSSWYKM